MHPAASIIAFTTLSGMGFGLLAFLGLGFPEVTGWSAFWFFFIAFALAVGGLIFSTFHLGHPERALKAFTQWRTSWLSREGWASVGTLGLMGIFAAFLVLFGIRLAPLGWLGALACMATVYVTSMIYASIRTVPRWSHWSTSVMFVAYSLSGGALLSGEVPAAILFLVLTGIAQFFAWKFGDSRFAATGSTAGTATGLGQFGKVRLFEGPHTSDNYLTKEMVFVVARKHSVKLRSIALALAFAVPVALLLLPFHHLLAALAVLCHVTGVLITRWLFFAEAEHTVSLFYGRD
ncbi:DmsC/YnfH family molybdoenzyme membrane anchor subunit [Oceaniovalibus sp. ACAM 378]|uniref:dimethyl sulfoxide reductase anchor subunit family protein n=1 Tax=Oceaniovalibus sp. ACAM 378 TaxID=2599923 RepID=UPI0011DA15C2|nr:DmsC/YnfH family molybdoenzyme membrane anchor subunit [Oceaniovalibus sp. ACAM 378]TYB90540.1 dibenzothiophene desulfurase [Oceaniovalibus sp. ACAM 378]